ncbi:VENN motif pre-toxin domain-containing protein [Enterobacter sp. Ap-1006]|uniref:VENN motif pre-toxin domain-containing protein n=1 Tax=Enterobacter sp. Ap-1006 TaxID=2608345 RepID=UPI0025707163|nr:VENN motif pre-toxin domain-containing protein [Enterobacter sp. Ap-1006]
MAHAVWGALAAQLSGGNAAAGAAGAFSGELAARHIAAEMFPNTKPGDLNQDQKQLVSLLGTMAAGIAGGVVGNSTAAATTGAQAGKNAVENNFLLSLMTPPPPVAGQTTPQTEANAVLAQKLDAVVKKFGSDIVKQCLSGGDCPVATQVAIAAIKAMINQGENGPSHTGNNDGQVDIGPNHTGNNNSQSNTGPNHTGNNGGQINIGPNHTGGDQSVEQLPNNTGNNEGAPDLPNHMENQGYDPNKNSVGNMGEFLKQPGFGSTIKDNTQKTNQQYQGQSIYKATDNVGG